jgi:hypothetical protein
MRSGSGNGAGTAGWWLTLRRLAPRSTATRSVMMTVTVAAPASGSAPRCALLLTTLLVFIIVAASHAAVTGTVLTGLVSNSSALRVAYVVNCLRSDGGPNLLVDGPQMLPKDFDIRKCGSVAGVDCSATVAALSLKRLAAASDGGAEGGLVPSRLIHRCCASAFLCVSPFPSVWASVAWTTAGGRPC